MPKSQRITLQLLLSNCLHYNSTCVGPDCIFQESKIQNTHLIMYKLAIFTILAVVFAISDCQQQQASKNLIDVYADSVFNYAVLNNRKPVVVYFGNDSCSACKWIYPQLERLAKNRSEKIYLAKVDTDKLADLAADYGVATYPTIMTLYYGEIIEVVEGPVWSKVVALVNNAAKL